MAAALGDIVGLLAVALAFPLAILAVGISGIQQLGGAFFVPPEALAAEPAAVGAYKRVAARAPNDPTVQLQLADAAETAGDYKTAIGAYQRFIKLAPDDPSVPTVKKRIKLLQSTPGVGGSGTR